MYAPLLLGTCCTTVVVHQGDREEQVFQFDLLHYCLCGVAVFMRGVATLLMFSSVARLSQLSAFCKSLPSHPKSSPNHLQMSTSSAVSLDRVSGDGIGGIGATLTPKVRPSLCSTYPCHYGACCTSTCVPKPG